MKKIIVFILALTMIFSASSVSFAADSYTEYFSEEREFIVNDDTYNWSTYFYSDENTGYLYSRNVDTEEVNLVYPQNVTNHYLWSENLFCVVDGKSIVKITVTGQNPQTILTTNKDIDQLYVNDDLIFYLMDNAIYRYHINSKTTDCIVQDDYIYFFYPYSNFVVEWSNDIGEIYKVNLKTRISSPSLINEYSFINEISTKSTTASTVYIHGVEIPYGDYSHGNFFNSSITSACPCHAEDSYCLELAQKNTCNSCQKENGTWQCFAFGHRVYKHIWGTYSTQNSQSHKINTTALARTVFWNIPSGTHVRVTLSGTGTNHSFILSSVSETGISVYEANWPGGCKIRHVNLTFSEVANLYTKIVFTIDAQHTLKNTYSHNSNVHWKECSNSNCNCKTYFGYHTYSTGTNYCSVCGRAGTAAKNIENSFDLKIIYTPSEID